jgi:hypothetical protein
VSPTLTNAYCTVDDLREQLGDLSSNNLSERQLVRAINAASRAVDNYTDRRFWADETPVTKVFPPWTDVRRQTDDYVSSSYEMWLPEDIADATGLVISTDTNGGGTYDTVWDATDYRLWPYAANTSGSLYGGWNKLESTGRLRFDIRGIGGNRGLMPVQITARFGWSFCPDPIEQATVLKAAQLFKRKDAPFGVVQFGDIAAVTITRKDADVVELLWPYVRDVAMVG